MGTISELKRKINLVDYIKNDGIVLRHGGANIYKGLCPFHHEKTPSLVVYEDNQTFHCFGCKTHGDIIDYVANRNSLTKMQAIQYLANENNFELDIEGNKEDFAKQKRLSELLTMVDEYFKYNFKCLEENHPAKQQITKRGLPITDVYGYCPSSDNFNKYFTSKGFTLEELREIGINTDNDFCRLSDRLVFTIYNIFGQPVGFTGRQLVENKNSGKYINTSNNSIFNKSKALYGIERAKDKARKDKKIILVEGQFDVEAMHSSGLTNTVAVSGSAFSKEQEKLILNIIGNDGKIILMLDGDSAGQNAMNHIFQKFPELQNILFIVILPDGKDPCEMIQSKTLFPRPISINSYYYNSIKREYLNNTPESKAEFIQKIQELFTNYIEDNVLKKNYLEKAANEVGVEYKDLKLISNKKYESKKEDLKPYIKCYLLALKVFIDTQKTNEININPQDFKNTVFINFIKELYDNRMIRVEGKNIESTNVIDKSLLSEKSQRILEEIYKQEYDILTDKLFIQSYYKSLIEQAKTEFTKERYDNGIKQDGV